VKSSVISTLPGYMQKAASFASTPIEAAEGASAIVVLVPWSGWRDIDPMLVDTTPGGRLCRPEVFDLRGVLDVPRWRAAGLRVHVIGRGDLEQEYAREDST